MGHGINEIEQAVLAQVETAPLKDYVKSFELYDGQFNVDDVNQFKGQLPAVFVSYIGDRFDEVSTNQTYMDNMRVSVIVAARDFRTNLESKTGSGGALQMLDDVKTILHKNNLGFADVVGMVLVERIPLIISKNLQVYGLDFKVEFVD